METAVLLAALLVQPGSPTECVPIFIVEDDRAYIPDAKVALRALPATTSDARAHAEPFDVLKIRKTLGDWMCVQTLKGDAGWIQPTAAGTTSLSTFAAQARRIQLVDKKWPRTVMLDIARGRVRLGFSEEQALIAAGDPIRRVTEETAKGVTVVLQYSDKTITLVGGRVSAVRSVQ